MEKIHLWQQEPEIREDWIQLSAVIELPNGKRQSYWYRIQKKYQSYLNDSCDPFIVGSLFVFMSRAIDVRVHGQASPSLLKNLCEYQAIWHCWRPEKYEKIEIEAEIERENNCRIPKKGVIAAFSGGVDSCFSVYRHRKQLCGRQTEQIQAGLMVHGFDIPLHEDQMFQQAAQKSKRILDDINIDLITIATNLRGLRQNWKDAYGAAVGSALRLFDNRFSNGLIASGEAYQHISGAGGSDLMLDSLLSNDTFRVIHDGAAFTRVDKIEHLVQWTEATRHLRVCWQGKQKDRNCGGCYKCVMTILAFRATGETVPPSFERDISHWQLMKLAFAYSIKSRQVQIRMKNIIMLAKRKGISEFWVQELQLAIILNQIANLIYLPQIKSKIQWVVRLFREKILEILNPQV